MQGSQKMCTFASDLKNRLRNQASPQQRKSSLRSVALILSPAKTRCSAVGSVPGLGPGCRRFESCHLDHHKESPAVFLRGIPIFTLYLYIGLSFIAYSLPFPSLSLSPSEWLSPPAPPSSMSLSSSFFPFLTLNSLFLYSLFLYSLFLYSLFL